MGLAKGSCARSRSRTINPLTRPPPACTRSTHSSGSVRSGGSKSRQSCGRWTRRKLVRLAPMRSVILFFQVWTLSSSYLLRRGQVVPAAHPPQSLQLRHDGSGTGCARSRAREVLREPFRYFGCARAAAMERSLRPRCALSRGHRQRAPRGARIDSWFPPVSVGPLAWS